MTSPPVIRYIKRNFDELEIAAVMAKVIYDSTVGVGEADLPVLAAIRRANPGLEESSAAEIGDYLAKMSDEQLAGMVSNVKGILHEIEFVAIENSDGDQIYASLFADTNHAGFDVSLLDKETGESYELQLKATDSHSYVQDWMEAHPEGDIRVTDEIAAEMGLEGTGLSNDDLTVRTTDFIDHLQEADDSAEIWSYLPELTVLSVSVAVWELWGRYQSGRISLASFKTMAVKLTAQKTLKIGLLTCALAIPVVNVAVGAAIVAKLVFGVQNLAESGGDKIDAYRPALAPP
jgi:hypothetical protein